MAGIGEEKIWKEVKGQSILGQDEFINSKPVNNIVRQKMSYDAEFLLIWLAMISIVILVAVIGLTIIGVIAFKKEDPATANKFVELLVKCDALRLVTALAIVIVVTALAFAKIISGEVTGTLLSGVAGYILGGLSRERKSGHKDEKGDNA